MLYVSKSKSCCYREMKPKLILNRFTILEEGKRVDCTGWEDGVFDSK